MLIYNIYFSLQQDEGMLPSCNAPANWVEKQIKVQLCMHDLDLVLSQMQTFKEPIDDCNKFFIASIPANSNTQIASSDWSQLTSKHNWQNSVLHIITPYNPYCSFTMKRRWVKKDNSRKSSLYSFRCSGVCTFTDCPVQFNLKILSFLQTNPPSSLSVLVEFTSSTVKHFTNERKSRQLRSGIRTTLKNELSFTSPTTLYNQKFTSLNQAELESGKRDVVGKTVQVYRKISSEGNKEQLPHDDLIISLKMVDNEIIQATKSDRQINGYIRRITAKPFSVSLFTEEGIRIYHHFAEQQVLYIDATGSIVSLKGTEYEGKMCLYYALVIGHANVGQPPVALAELITTEHSILAISHFLEEFRRHEGLLFGYRNITIPKCIVIDRSLVLLLSCLRVFNMETMSDYFHRCFRVLNRCSKESDTKHTFVVACISHVMKNAKFDMKRIL